MRFRYTVGMASIKSIHSHLMQCEDIFVQSLEIRVNIRSYAKKIFEKTITFEAWDSDNLIGLIAAYFNDPNVEMGFLTNVSIAKSYMGKGVASTLLTSCIEYAQKKGYKFVVLEVLKTNDQAINLYHKFKFKEFEERLDTILMKLVIQ